MSVGISPKFLNESDPPLMQHAIADLLYQELEWPQLAAQVIAEYACPPDQVETSGMIAFFERLIPVEWIQLGKEHCPEANAVFDQTPCESEHLFPGSKTINNSEGRKLIALMHTYTAFSNWQEANGHVVALNLQSHDFLGRIQGITIHTRCDYDIRTCHAYVFENLDWYKKIDPDQKLFLEPKRVLDFLKSKGFTTNRRPSKDQIVVYHTATKIKHFGKVLEVESESRVMVISKFGLSHIYRHLLGMVPHAYGNNVIFLDPPIDKSTRFFPKSK